MKYDVLAPIIDIDFFMQSFQNAHQTRAKPLYELPIEQFTTSFLQSFTEKLPLPYTKKN